MAVTARDLRPIRSVVAYRGETTFSFDELSCGHVVPCRRQLGGVRVLNHDEACGECPREVTMAEAEHWLANSCVVCLSDPCRCAK
jgi:hypothetical protein